MTRFLQFVTVIYLIAVWIIFAVAVADVAPWTTAGAPDDLADAIMLAGAIGLSIPAAVFLVLAQLGSS